MKLSDFTFDGTQRKAHITSLSWILIEENNGGHGRRGNVASEGFKYSPLKLIMSSQTASKTSITLPDLILEMQSRRRA